MPAPTTNEQVTLQASGSKGKALPQNIEAEKTVLSACLLSTGVFEEVSLKLRPEDFYRPAHRIIFETMRDMNARSVPIDVISVADSLKAAFQLEAVGGQPYLLDLSNNTFALTSWQHHADIVSRDAMRRQLLLASANISSLAYDSPADPKELISQAEATLFGVTEKAVNSSFKDIKTLIIEANDQIAEMANRGEVLQGVPTGFKDVDQLFNGLRGGQLIILAARPGVGKSSFAMNLAVNAAKQKSTVAFFSLEMSSVEITKRLLSAESGINLSVLNSGRIDNNAWAPLFDASERLSNIDLYVDDSPGLSLVELRTKARRMMRNVEKGLIVVDYLQLMTPVIPHPNNRTMEVAEISRGLKMLAKELDVPIMALAQLSRAVESRTDKRPMLSDLRESGSIEQDADIVMFIDRSTSEAEAESDKRPDWGVAELIVAKHRSGPTRDLKLTWLAERTKFTDYFDDSSY